jgi:hypothetical protein
MPDMTATIPHQLGREEAKRRIQSQLASFRHQHNSLFAGLQETWTGDTVAFSLSAMGQSLSGHLDVGDQAVHVTVVLPWYLRMLASSLKSKIEQQGRLLLDDQRSGPRT